MHAGHTRCFVQNVFGHDTTSTIVGQKSPMCVGEDPKETLEEWFGRHELPNEVTKQDLQKVITELRTTHDAKKIGVQGFCWCVPLSCQY